MIAGFFGPHRWLSNFWPCPLTGTDGRTYPTAEHAYQACKMTTAADRERVRLAPTPAAAKRLARTLPQRADWDDIRLGVMTRILRLKFAPGTELAARLLETGNQALQETNTWHDRFWGVCGGVGENHLGRILEQIRDELAR